MGYQLPPPKPKQQEAQPRDERPPLQGYGVSMEGWSGKIAHPPQEGGQSTSALLALMEHIEQAIAVNHLPGPDYRLIEDRRGASPLPLGVG